MLCAPMLRPPAYPHRTGHSAMEQPPPGRRDGVGSPLRCLPPPPSPRSLGPGAVGPRGEEGPPVCFFSLRSSARREAGAGRCHGKQKGPGEREGGGEAGCGPREPQPPARSRGGEKRALRPRKTSGAMTGRRGGVSGAARGGGGVVVIHGSGMRPPHRPRLPRPGRRGEGTAPSSSPGSAAGNRSAGMGEAGWGAGGPAVRGRPARGRIRARTRPARGRSVHAPHGAAQRGPPNATGPRPQPRWWLLRAG